MIHELAAWHLWHQTKDVVRRVVQSKLCMAGFVTVVCQSVRLPDVQESIGWSPL